MTFYYGKDSHDEWHWELKGANDRILAVSGETFSDEDSCTDAITLVKSAREAAVVKVE